MGQRSQIYYKLDNELIVANYYQWNYGERMISRARYTIEYLNEMLDYSWELKNKTKISRYFDINFDYKDIAISSDIFKEWEEYGKDWCDTFTEYAFECQDNNDGKLFVWVDTEKKIIKYALTDTTGKEIYTPEEYMIYDTEGFSDPFPNCFRNKKEERQFRSNAAKIKKLAQLMTKEELEQFKNI